MKTNSSHLKLIKGFEHDWTLKALHGGLPLAEFQVFVKYHFKIKWLTFIDHCEVFHGYNLQGIMLI